MWDGLLILLLLCIVMAIASFLSGMLPLYFTLSSRQLRLISALGTGVLVGTALIIIIPEGVETLYSASGSGHSHDERSLSLASRRSTIAIDHFPASFKHDTWRRAAQYEEDNALPNDIGYGGGGGHGHLLEYVTQAQELENAQRQDDGENNEEETSDAPDSETPPDTAHARDPHAYIGISLIAGFILMYLIDTLPQNLLNTRHAQPQRTHISLNNLSFHNNSNNSSEATAHSPSLPGLSQLPSHDTAIPSFTTSPTTTGLVIHALADGIALGASSTSTTSRLTFIIFIALILHKAPAAFGLSAVLLKQNLSKRTARAHLLVFALSAPAGALLTWAAAHLLGFASATDGAAGVPEFFTGVLLLFSGGTFLYVAVHALQENGGGGDGAGGGGHHRDGGQMNGYRGVPMSDMYAEGGGAGVGANGAQGAGKGGGRGGVGLGELGITVLGMLVPLLINFGHGH